MFCQHAAQLLGVPPPRIRELLGRRIVGLRLEDPGPHAADALPDPAVAVELRDGGVLVTVATPVVDGAPEERTRPARRRIQLERSDLDRQAEALRTFADEAFERVFTSFFYGRLDTAERHRFLARRARGARAVAVDLFGR